MSAMPSSTPSEVPAGLLLVKLLVAVPAVRHAGLKNNRFSSARPSLAMRVPFALVRFLIAFSLGVAATFAWQSYGDAVRDMIASAPPKLSWLAAQAAPVTPSARDTIVRTVPSPNQSQLKAVSLDLDGVRQRVDRIAASQEQITQIVDQLTAGQQQMGRDIVKLQAISQYALYKNPEDPPRATPAQGPMPVPRPSRARTMR